VNQQDQQAIEELFRHLYQTAGKAGPRDGAAEALIDRKVQQGPPGLLYQMAQTLVAQQYTVNQLRSELASYQRQGGAPAGFAPPQGTGYRQAYGQPAYQQPGWQQPGRQGGGFLAGAGQLALGIGGGILGAEVLTSIFDGGGGLFGGDREYDDGYRDGFAAGDDDRDQGDYQGQDPGNYDDGGGGYDSGGYDDGGGFDGGGDFGDFS
jgi:uncharacterized protein